MKIISLLFIICISLILTRDPPVITLYEESLCPFCLKFENTQISRLLKHPNKNLLFKSINTIWFGNAKELEDSAPFARKFICQHGSNECYGNYIFNCAQNNLVLFDDLYNFYSCAAKFALDDLDNVDFDAAFINQEIISWICQNGSKPMRQGSAWTIHGSPDWSQDHVELSKEDAQYQMVQCLTALGFNCEDADISMHRWRYAKTQKPLGKSHLWDAKSGLGVAGDWCLGHRVEEAFVSGLELALAVLKKR